MSEAFDFRGRVLDHDWFRLLQRRVFLLEHPNIDVALSIVPINLLGAGDKLLKHSKL